MYLNHGYFAREDNEKNLPVREKLVKKLAIYEEAVSKLEQPCSFRFIRDWSLGSKRNALISASIIYGISLPNDGTPILVQTPCGPCTSKLHNVDPQECGCGIETKVVHSEDGTQRKKHFKWTEMQRPRFGINVKGPLYHPCREGCLMPPEWILERTLDDMLSAYWKEPFIVDLLAQRKKYGWKGIEETPETPTMIYEPEVLQNPYRFLSDRYGDVSAILT
ncbi:hypothetical protein BDP27DRAFT_1397687 [Rhodocollybia butyracea]|uniref:Uncharacterized protein n=1 Tax=Rhodocollybia butyracea TaxID=206335 RepID=A0A9P5Q2P0_9AGAR|nr:hypothetical protein BDP27DRAFT_1397687 [Rhodocollybia butyracea]